MITQDDVLYMIVTDRFADGDPNNNAGVDRSAPNRHHGGDLLGIIQRMPYLRELGVTALWITPVYPNPADGYHGYHPLDFEGVDPHLCSPELGPSGSREVVRRFVEVAHENHMKVVFDAVICHTAPAHPWLTKRPEWFNKSDSSPEKWWIWGLPDLNHDRIEVNVFFAKNLLEWISFTRVDGVRIDAAKHVERPFWRVLKALTKGVCPDVTLIGEVFASRASEVAPYQAQRGFDSVFDFPLYCAMVDVFAKEQSFGRIARAELSEHEPPGVMNEDEMYRNANQLITFLGNHDTPRFFHLAGGADQGEEAFARAKLAFTFLFTTRGIPQIFYGDELAMDGGPDPDNRRDMRWDLVDYDAAPSFAEAHRAREMGGLLRRLITMRKASLALKYGLQTTVYVTPTLHSFIRGFPHDARLVVLNNSWELAELNIPIHANPRLSGLTCCRLPDGLKLADELGSAAETQISDGCVRVRLEGKSAAVYRPVDVPPN